MPKIRTLLAAAATTILVAYAVPADAAQAGATKNIVLVHGAFADGSGWKPVADILRKDGYTVSVVQQPETSLEEDVAATNGALDRLNGPAVLVGHSYGGMVITEAGNNEHVKALVYVAALQPDAGESLAKLVATAPALSKGLHRPRTAFCC